MLLNLIYLIAAVLVVLIGYAAVKPSDFKITRSISIKATPEAPFTQVNDFHNWAVWSPWARMEPEALVTYTGESGLGATQTWAGKRTGEGTATIIESKPYELIRMRLDFRKPFAATNIAEFTFIPQDGGTLVSWTMTGEHNIVGRFMCLFMNVDKIVGTSFEQGLAEIKDIVEG